MVNEVECRLIPLTRNKYTIVNASDYGSLVKYTWSADLVNRRYYAITQCGPDRQKIRMHQLLLGSNGGDHRDGNGLNNMRFNLRPATAQQNAQNVRVRITSKSGYKGVSFSKQRQKWRATITNSGKQRHIGFFKTAENAASARNIVALQLEGEFAWLNVAR